MIDPLGVRASAQAVMAQARYVSIDEGNLAQTCAAFEARLRVPEWNTHYHFGDGTARTANYILLLDALNFSFWDDPRWRITYHGERLDGYWALAAALKRAIEEGDDITDARRMAAMDETALAHVLRGDHHIPLFAARLAHIHEVGDGLLAKYDGQAARLIERCSFDAATIAAQVVADFPSFRDEAVYHGQTVKIYKRAQIFAADLYGAYHGVGSGALRGMDALTCFADYKLPQILRRFGIMHYTDDLARRVDARVELPPGSDEEIEIRAATIVAVECMREMLAARDLKLSSVEIDWALWDAAQGAPPDGKPYHRTRTIYY
ncbi:MAG: hypothetical protein HZB53_10135 [Chloroflexi bacterium]|nr:hypothetical protein [Chloroflexota bacterium]